LSLLDLSLELRRLRADLITTYKVTFGLLDVSSNFFVFRDNSVTRGHPYKVMLGRCDNSSQRQFLLHRIANVCNSLPAADIDFTNLISFRASIQNINLRTFTRFQSRFSLILRIYDPFLLLGHTLDTMQGPVCLLNWRTDFYLFLHCT